MRDKQEVGELVDEIEVTSWDELGLEVKFDFSSPLGISQGKTQDYVQGRVKKESFAFFISQTSSFILEEELSMNIAIPAQLPKGLKQEVVEEVAESAGNGFLAIVIIQLVAQSILKSGMKDMFTLYFII